MPDFAAARNSLAAFADMVRRPLTEWQVNSLRLQKRTTCIVAPRQSGKSRSLAVLALWKALREPGTHVLIISAGEDAARRLLGEVRQIAMESELLRGSVLDDLASLVTLSNGSKIRSVPASERQIRGWSVDLLLVDEAALVDEELLTSAALPTTAARPDARIILASSATVASGSFYTSAQAGLQGSEYVETFAWVLADAAWISASTIAAARESMTPTRFAAEYEGVFASGTDSLFPLSLLERARAPYVAPGLAGLDQVRALGGVDWGATSDRSALVAIARMERPAGLFAIIAAHAWPSGQPIGGPDGVIEQIVEVPAHWDQLTTETNGLGWEPSQELARRLEADMKARPRPRVELEYVNTTANSKAATYAKLRMLMEQGRLVIPTSADELFRELLLLRVELTPAGNERIEASKGFDDIADALYLAAGPRKDRDGKWTSRLAKAATEIEAPASIAPGDDTVETGAGLVLPKEPRWVRLGGERHAPITSMPSPFDRPRAFAAAQAQARSLESPFGRWFAEIGAPRPQVSGVQSPSPAPSGGQPFRKVPGEKPQSPAERRQREEDVKRVLLENAEQRAESRLERKEAELRLGEELRNNAGKADVH